MPASSLSELRRLKSSPGLFLQQTGLLAPCLWIHSAQPIWLLMFCKFGAVCFRKPGGKHWWAWGSLGSRRSLSHGTLLGPIICLYPWAQQSAGGPTRPGLPSSQRALGHPSSPPLSSSPRFCSGAACVNHLRVLNFWWVFGFAGQGNFRW